MRNCFSCNRKFEPNGDSVTVLIVPDQPDPVGVGHLSICSAACFLQACDRLKAMAQDSINEIEEEKKLSSPFS